MISARLCNLSKLDSIPVRVTPRQLWFKVKRLVRENVDTKFIQSLKIKEGKTQRSEKKYMRKLYTILDDNGFKYTKAKSQSPIDLRNIHHFSDPKVKLMIEVKLLSNGTVMKCNDTVPGYHKPTDNPDNLPVRYLLFVCGNRSRIPQLIFVDDGKDFKNVSQVFYAREHILALRELDKKTNKHKKPKSIDDHKEDIIKVKHTFNNLMDNYEELSDEINIFPRLNFSYDIRDYLTFL